ncbi:hypothetical protein BSNK01_05670 [Bacillaceae bacterium]
MEKVNNDPRWPELKKEIEAALGKPLSPFAMTAGEWRQNIEGKGVSLDAFRLSFVLRKKTYFVLRRSPETVEGWCATEPLPQELCRLIVLAIRKEQTGAWKGKPSASFEEWIRTRDWREERFPFLLFPEGKAKPLTADEWVPIVREFFDGRAEIVPLAAQEILVLVPHSILREAETGTVEEAAELWAASLIELLQNEGFVQSSVVTTHPVSTATELPSVLEQLRLYRRIGQTYQPVRRIYAPWNLRWELILSRIAPAERANLLRYLNEQYRLATIVNEELAKILRAFFANDLNVSETARTLFVHRNTLLYRFDKLKEETGLDVKKFADAKILSLYLSLQRDG